MAFCIQIFVIVHHYFKYCIYLANTIPGAADPTRGVASRDFGLGVVSHDHGLNRRERWYSFSNVAINDAVILQ
jgi:hypothetical protein